ncbi:response regulator transcription factor [Nocardioides aquiterrae]|uniref:response regulator transcription factor n=1 Tax=Nocardioides aquiterrae TaxID=203799 RepID=UPI0031DE0238
MELGPEPAPEGVIRVLLVEDHEVLATSLAMVLDREPDLDTVGVAATLAAARRLLVSARPDVVLLDHRLPDGDGVAAIPELLELRPEARVVVLTASTADRVLTGAIAAGASGFVSKSRGVADVCAAVRAAAAGEAVISAEMLARLLRRLQRRDTPAQPELTGREVEVLELVAEGLTNAVIAQRLHLSVHTVRNHIANLSQKLGAHSKLEALAIAVRQGLVAQD